MCVKLHAPYTTYTHCPWKLPELNPFSETNFQDFYQDSNWFFKGSKIHFNPYNPKISMLIFLTASHTLHTELTDFQNFPGPVAFFQDFPVLENAIIKFQDFPGFPGPVRTLCLIPCHRCENSQLSPFLIMPGISTVLQSSGHVRGSTRRDIFLAPQGAFLPLKSRAS